MFSVTMTIQRPYMALQENFVTFFPRHWRSNNHIWHFRKTLSHVIRDTDNPTTVYGRSRILQKTFASHKNLQGIMFVFLSFKLVKRRSNETLASVGLAQARPNQVTQFVCWKQLWPKLSLTKTSAIANILFDEGVQRSFISQQLADVLQLSLSWQEDITLAPFSADTMTPQSLSVASIKVVAKTGELIPLSVLIVPKIAAQLQTVSHPQLHRLPYLQGLTLVHPITGDRPFEVSLLIGVDRPDNSVQQ